MRSEIRKIQTDFILNHPELESIRLTSYNYDLVFKALAYTAFIVEIAIIASPSFSPDSGGVFKGQFFWYFISFIVLIVFVVIVHLFTKKRLCYENEFNKYKPDYINNLVKHINSSFEYIENEFPANDILKTLLFKEKWLVPSKMNIRDYLKGSHLGVDVSLIELNFGQKGGAQVGTNFRPSLLVIADFNKILSSETYILDKTMEANQFSNVNCNPKGRKIVLENLEFDKLFSTTSEDEIECRFIFSFSFMERLLELKKSLNLKQKLYISFAGNKVSILIYNKTIFEPEISKPINEDDSFFRFYDEISCVLKLIDILRLNEKIWK